MDYTAVHRRMFNHSVTLSKVSKSSVSDMYGSVTETVTDYTIMGMVDRFSREDRLIMRLGNLSGGDARFFALPSYTVNNQTVTVEVNDYITFQGVKYRVTAIDDVYDIVYGKASFRECILQRVVDE